MQVFKFSDFLEVGIARNEKISIFLFVTLLIVIRKGYRTRDTGQIFSGYRVLGLVTNEIPLCTRFVKLRKEHLVVTCVGKSFHTYSVKNLRLLSISPPQEDDITAMAVDHFHVYTAHGPLVLAWRRGFEHPLSIAPYFVKEILWVIQIQHRYQGHQHDIHLLMPFGQHLISVDTDNCLNVWNIRDEEQYCSLRPDPAQFQITAITHPLTYLNKVLLGSQQGTLQLWSLESGRMVREYNHGWASAVTSIQQDVSFKASLWTERSKRPSASRMSPSKPAYGLKGPRGHLLLGCLLQSQLKDRKDVSFKASLWTERSKRPSASRMSPSKPAYGPKGPRGHLLLGYLLQSQLMDRKAPAKDVVAVGLRCGRIYLYNLHLGTVVMKLIQEYGAVTAISCRMDMAVMATSSPDGHVVIWDLEKREPAHQLLGAHSGPVTGLKFLSGEPVLLTSSPDNSLKMWLFDMPDGSGRLLSHRSGHALPPTRVRFYDGYGQFVLSADLASTLHMFSTVADNLHKCLGQALFNKKAAKRMKRNNTSYDGKLAAITQIASANQREKEWDNVVCLHQNHTLATTWTTHRGTMGSHKLVPERFHRSHGEEQALSLSVSECGNFVVIGYSTGHIDKFNIQSGQHRSTFGSKEGKDKAAHTGAVSGLAIDIYSQILVSGGDDCLLKFWNFRNPQQAAWKVVELESSVEQIECHRQSGLLAVAQSDFDVVIVDFVGQKVVRKFQGHLCKILDMAISPDARWLVTASQDRTIRVWNIPTSQLIDCFLTESVCTSLTFAPQSNFLATTHQGERGVSLWVNTTLCDDVLLTPLPRDYAPRLLKLQSSGQEDTSGILEEEELAADYTTPEQVEDLVSLTTVNMSHWKNILDIDLIIERNRPKEAPKMNTSLPFFLSDLKPTTQGVSLSNIAMSNIALSNIAMSNIALPNIAMSNIALPNIAMSNIAMSNTAIHTRGILSWRFCCITTSFEKLTCPCVQKPALETAKSAKPMVSEFRRLLKNGATNGDYAPLFDWMITKRIITVSVEIEYLSPAFGGGEILMVQFLEGLLQCLKTKRNYNILAAYHACFIKTHREEAYSIPQVRQLLQDIEEEFATTWPHISRKYSLFLSQLPTKF
ncbi:WDR36 [Cordylochernes scorpioides]|uniref:WDR36 n=1 Tax=Cordylochernes scorpioides TaxID=51811 RepID=A0ABY6LPX7_9ARAC|nr:WDR36 [Cordylochernes scorpioides]